MCINAKHNSGRARSAWKTWAFALTPSLVHWTDASGLFCHAVPNALKRTSIGHARRSPMGLGCVKTRRDSIAMEEVVRLRPFEAFN